MSNSASSASDGTDPGSLTPPRDSAPHVPDHELLRCIGSGSYGEVWLARNVMGTYRAVKVVRRRTFPDERPYEREFRGMQRFEPVSRTHDGLVDILQVGRDDGAGYYYYVMELGDDAVLGQDLNPDRYEPRTLGKFLAECGRLPLGECLRVGLSLAAALQHLHKHGLIHRDIKPSNIIFVNGIPKIADIGLVAEVGAAKSLVGTEGFIPPEGPGTVQADIYSLGKVLYEISSGKDRQTFPELPTGLDELENLRDYLELNEVVIKACESNAHKRYHTAEQVHADLLLLQAGKSVKRLRLLERRLALLSRIGLVAGLLVLTGLLVVAAAYYQVNRDRRKARQNLAVSHVAYGMRLMDEGDLLGALPSFAEALRLERDDAERERLHRVHLGVALRQCPKLTHLWFQNGRINAASFSPDGHRVVVAGVNGNAAVWDAEGGLQVFRLIGHRPEKEVESACYSGDGRFLLTAGEDGMVRIWNAENGEEIVTASPLLHPATVYSANFSRQGDRIVTACKDGKVRVWTMGSNKPIREFVAHAAPVRHASFSPDDRRIVTASIDETAKVWNADTGAQLGETMRHENWVYDACFSPDGLSIVTASYDKTARIWDAAAGKLIATLRSDAPVRSARFSPDGRYIVTTCWDYDFAVRVWGASTGQEAFPPLKHTSYPFTASFDPQGHRILTACANGVCHVWDLAGNKWIASSAPVFYSPNGNVLVTLEGGVLQARNAATGSAVSPAIRPGYPILDVKLNQDGSRLLTVTAQAPTEGKKVMLAQLWEASTGQALSPLFTAEPSIINASLSVVGHRMVVTAGTVVQVCSTTDGKTLSVLSHSGPVNQAALSSDASRAVTTAGTNAHLWNAITGVQLRTWPHVSEVGHAEFSSSGRLVVTCSGAGHMTKQYAQLWDGRTGERIGNPLWHIDGVLHASFSPDENRLVTASEDRSAVIWETATGRMVGSPLIHKHQVIEARFSPNGRWVVTLDIEDTVQVWDAAEGTPITPRLKHPFPVWSVQFIADGGRIIAKDARVGTWVNWETIEPKGYASWRVWDLTPDSRPTDELMLLGQLLSGHKSEQIGGGLPPETEALRVAWQTLTRRQPSEFTVSPTEIAAWHQREAEANEKAGHWKAALFHWEQLAQANPDDPILRGRLAAARDKLDSEPARHTDSVAP